MLAMFNVNKNHKKMLPHLKAYEHDLNGIMILYKLIARVYTRL